MEHARFVTCYSLEPLYLPAKLTTFRSGGSHEQSLIVRIALWHPFKEIMRELLISDSSLGCTAFYPTAEQNRKRAVVDMANTAIVRAGVMTGLQSRPVS
jgi:hypothetical protein